jgi:hypothetical protein
MAPGVSPGATPTRGFAWRAGPIDAFTDGDDTVLRLMPDGGTLTVRHGRLRRGVGYAQTPRPERQFLARVGAIVRLRARGKFHMHAAGAVDPSGRGWLLAGENGAGKSTLTYALARQGWRMLGDDGVIIERKAGGVIAHAWREPLYVSKDLAAVFPELDAAEAPPLAGDLRGRVPMRCAIAQRAPVAALVFLRRGERDVVEPLPTAEALAMLVRQSSWVLMADGYAAEHLATLRELVERARLIRLTHTPRQLRDIALTLERALA